MRPELVPEFVVGITVVVVGVGLAVKARGLAKHFRENAFGKPEIFTAGNVLIGALCCIGLGVFVTYQALSGH